MCVRGAQVAFIYLLIVGLDAGLCVSWWPVLEPSMSPTEVSGASCSYPAGRHGLCSFMDVCSLLPGPVLDLSELL